MTSLTPKQQRFIEEYVVDFNGSAAAIRAGYAESGSRQEATRLLANADIAAAVEARKKEISDRVALTPEWVLGELQDIARACKATMPAVAKSALELLGKHVGLWPSERGGAVQPLPIPEPANDTTNPALTGVVLAFRKRAGAAK